MSAASHSVIPPSSTPTGSSTPSTSTTYTADPISTGAAKLNGDAESSKNAQMNGNTAVLNEGKANGHGPADPVIYALNLTSWAFNIGYLHQEWTDVHFTFFNSGLKAHRLIIARSPYLARLMANVAPGSVIHLSFQDENITEESVHIALQHLYNPSQHLINVHNARSVLPTSYLLGGMPELAHHAYTVMHSSLNADYVSEYVQWLNVNPDQNAGGIRNRGAVGGTVDSWIGSSSSGEGRYGEWSARLKQDVLDYLLHALPRKIISDNSPITADPRLLSVYSKLPYDLFKSLIENPELPIPSMQERFQFAKKVIAQRKKIASASSATNGSNGASVQVGPPMEESVVLAFNGGEGMGIHVTRKPKKSRALWKVEG
ncbi:hypothetical protein IAT40_001643 [Kwoniella sp. CBS 6097]